MMEQDWEGKALDKDIIKEGNKEYGPETCRYVTQTTNSTLAQQGRKRLKDFDLPRGITRYEHGGKRFQAVVGKYTSSYFKRGKFVTLEEAITYYKEHKAVQIRMCIALERDPAIIKGIERAAQKVTNSS
jgi:hypothetical protein